VPADRLKVLGFPVPPIFAQDRPVRTAPSEGEALRVLYMINADKGSAPALVSRLLQVEGISLSVTVGRDDALKAAVETAVRDSGRTAKLYGWTPHMPELLMSHHVLIGKAGGAAVQETIAARTPMIVTKVVPGQEEGNARLLVENGCGAVCPTRDAIAGKLEQLRANGAALWKEWEQNLGKLSRPDAALRMAEMILE
jgi:processive 1,2-diacylglycerol beta-glucosyltransferase